jgi:hypothetical protein
MDSITAARLVRAVKATISPDYTLEALERAIHALPDADRAVDGARRSGA